MGDIGLDRYFQLTQRGIDKSGQAQLIPHIALEGWWTTRDEVDHDNHTIIQLYQDQASSEQFQSELKTELDLERLPSRKFDTNDLILALGALTGNVLRWIGLMDSRASYHQ